MQEKGQVIFFNEEEGYGFIRPASGGDNIFVHATGINADGPNRYLLKGDVVTFDVTRTDRGSKAVNVSVIYEG
ncbi:cold-shock protein [Paenibacillus naphthalenovorans]|uniref:cold-shock protein n=1 Tax=Paenibacillus naphthalenovorans TaxID=162209 RepID=UPI003D2C045B